MELIAHRAGNVVSTLPEALEIADLIELDVHGFRGRLEVRHAKVFWPFALRWDRWELVPASAARPSLSDVLAAIPPGAHLWLDLKGLTAGFTSHVLDAVGDRYAVTISARSWWILSPARSRPGVRALRSVGNRMQR